MHLVYSLPYNYSKQTNQNNTEQIAEWVSGVSYSNV
jgi:hypothetical protein